MFDELCTSSVKTSGRMLRVAASYALVPLAYAGAAGPIVGYGSAWGEGVYLVVYAGGISGLGGTLLGKGEESGLRLVSEVIYDSRMLKKLESARGR